MAKLAATCAVLASLALPAQAARAQRLTIAEGRAAVEKQLRHYWRGEQVELAFGECRRVSSSQVSCEATVTGAFFIVEGHPIVSTAPEDREAERRNHRIVVREYEPEDA